MNEEIKEVIFGDDKFGRRDGLPLQDLKDAYSENSDEVTSLIRAGIKGKDWRSVKAAGHLGLSEFLGAISGLYKSKIGTFLDSDLKFDAAKSLYQLSGDQDAEAYLVSTLLKAKEETKLRYIAEMFDIDSETVRNTLRDFIGSEESLVRYNALQAYYSPAKDTDIFKAAEKEILKTYLDEKVLGALDSEIQK